MADDSWETILNAYLADKGLRVTRQRHLIAEAFFSAGGHPNIDQVYEAARAQDPRIGQATVYRTLKLLVDCGLAHQSDFGDGTTRYEPAHAEHHDHLMCVDCGRIVEFRNDTIEHLQDEIALDHGFKVTDHRLVIYGACTLQPCPHRNAGHGG